MAEASPDIEQAPSIIRSEGGKADEKPQPSNNNVEADAAQMRPKNVEAERVVVLSFRALQLERIAELQDDLLRLAAVSLQPIPNSKSSPKPENHKTVVDKALRDYAEALRTYETLSLNAIAEIPPGSRLIGILSAVEQHMTIESNRASRLSRFAVAAFKYFDKYFKRLLDVLPSSTYSTLVWAGVRVIIGNASASTSVSEFVCLLEKTTGNLGFRELDKRGRILRAQKKAFTGRIVMALFGGAALIGPMLIMTLHRSLNTSLITVSVATFIFALILALCATDSEGKDILAATAAYAAVLVVFVGTSGTG